MPTLDEWQQALEIPHTIYVDSTQELANQINSIVSDSKFASEGGIPKTAVGTPEFDPPRYIQVAPVEILAALGRITTPRIDNLADISSTWARIRYIWAIEPMPAGTRMCLSQVSKEIDFHQKGLLSDEMGVGIAYYVISNYFDGTNPIDVDVALNDGAIPNLSYRYSTKPDYIFEHPTDGYVVVECKGSQSSESASKGQLRRGLEQVPSIELDGQTLKSYVIGSSLSTNGLKTFIVDPPDNGNLSKRDNRKRFQADKTRFTQAVQSAQAASLYQFIGGFDKARAILNTKKEHSQRENITPTKQRIDIIEEDYIGQIQEFRYSIDGINIRIFQGIPEYSYNMLESGNFQHVGEETKAMFSKAKKVSDEYKKDNNFDDETMQGAYFVDRSHNTIRATVVDRDGTLTQFELR